MMKSACVLASLLLFGCGAVPSGEADPSRDTSAHYTPPEESGLPAVRPFPSADSICQVIGENDLTNRFLDDSFLLIGCPHYETGAIEDRISEGAVVLERIGDWTLMAADI